MRMGYTALNVEVPRETKEQLYKIRRSIGIRTLTDTLIIVIDEHHRRMEELMRKQQEEERDD